MMVDLGKIAYDAYGKHRGWVVFDGSPMPSWEEQSPELCAAWTAAASAVADECWGTVSEESKGAERTD